MCQLCRFTQELEMIGDECVNLRAITAADVISGQVQMPFTQKKGWAQVQHNCPIHAAVKNLIKTGQTPNTHKTNGENTTIKLIHNYFCQGKLIIDEDRIIMIKVPNGYYNGHAMSIPPSYAPGLVQALHYKMQHPSRSQLLAIISRYFHCIAMSRVVSEVTDNCHTCLSLKPLPTAVTEQTTTVPDTLGVKFSADVIERATQKLLVVRETVSSFTWVKRMLDQTVETLKTSLVEAILPVIPNSKVSVRVDAATTWQSLEQEHQKGSGILAKYNINLEIGSFTNVNKNPEGENAVKEVQKEILRLDPEAKVLTDLQIAMVMKQINTRVRFKGWAAQEILLGRDQAENKKLDIRDSDLTAQIKASREAHHKRVKPDPISEQFAQGDLIYVKTDLTKTQARETHIVFGQKNGKIQYKKLKNQLRARTYSSHLQQLVKIPAPNVDQDIKPDMDIPTTDQPNKTNRAGRPLRSAATKAPKAWADLHCIRCESQHRLGFCPEDQSESTIDYTPRKRGVRPPINPPQNRHQPRVQPEPQDQQLPTSSSATTAHSRSQSPAMVTEAQNPNYRSPHKALLPPRPPISSRKSARIKDIPKTDYKHLDRHGRTRQ